jgi:outer membrane protein assembly factor BamB
LFSPSEETVAPPHERIVWALEGYDNGGRPWVDERRVYFLGWQHRLTVLEKETGRLSWTVDFPVTSQFRTVGFGGFTAQGKVIVGDRWLFALDTADGRELWRFAPPEGVDVGRDIPELWNDLVFTGSSNGLVFAVDLATGTQRWVTRVGPERHVGTWIAPVRDGTVYVGITDFEAQENGEPQGAVAALDASTGALLWKSDIPHHVDPMSPTATIDPVAVGSVVVVGARDGPVYALDRITGEQRWKLPPFPFPHVTDAALIRDIHSLTACDGMLVVGSTSSIVVALDSETGAERWRTPGSPGSVDWLACDERSVYVYRPFGFMEVLDRATGDRRWAITQGYDFVIGIAIEGGRIYAGGLSGLYALRND